jgi:hypothetical protein
MSGKMPKTLEQKLSDLDDHLFLLDHHLDQLANDRAHIKSIASELRLLLCPCGRPNSNSYREGFLWRLVDELNVSDILHLQLAGNLDVHHPRTQGLLFIIPPIERAGFGHPQLLAGHYSFKELVKELHAVFVSHKCLTHEQLIKVVANQIGSAHEDDEIDCELYDLGQIFMNGAEPYIPILVKDADFTLEIGERVFKKSEKEHGYQKKCRVKRSTAGASS